jgi:tetratricopeptide (TPR) repeat protein
MKSRRVFFLLVIGLALRNATAVDVPVDHWFEQANAFYEQQRYDSAEFYYEKITAADVRNAAVYYNLGNTYFRQKKAGLALLFFERARKLSPNDQDIRANIRFTQSAIIDRIPEPPQSFVETLFRYLHNVLPLETQLWLLFLLLLTLSLLFVAGLYAPPALRLWIIYTGSILLLATTVCGISAGIKIYSNATLTFAIELSPSIDAKNQPNGNKILFTVHEGTKFRVRQQLGEWSLVSLPTGVSGWVQTSSLGII